MKKIITGILTGVLLCSVISVNAQQRALQMNINLSGAAPLGDFKEIVPSTSIRGWNASVLYGITDKISVGLGAGFQDYYHKNERQMYRSTDGDISAVLSYSIQTIPVLLTGRYNFMPESVVQPYAGLGLGGNMVMYRQLLGEFGGTETSFKFAARPELGIQIPFRKGGETAFNLGAAYNYMPFNENSLSNLNNISIQAGIKFPMRR